MQKLTDLDCKICNETSNDEELIKYNELKQDLEFIDEENARGAFIGSRIEHIESDEKSTAFFLNTFKQVFQKKTINIIKTEDVSKITEAKEILCELDFFYSNLKNRVPTRRKGLSTMNLFRMTTYPLFLQMNKVNLVTVF